MTSTTTLRPQQTGPREAPTLQHLHQNFQSSHPVPGTSTGQQCHSGVTLRSQAGKCALVPNPTSPLRLDFQPVLTWVQPDSQDPEILTCGLVLGPVNQPKFQEGALVSGLLGWPTDARFPSKNRVRLGSWLTLSDSVCYLFAWSPTPSGVGLDHQHPDTEGRAWVTSVTLVGLGDGGKGGPGS